MRNRSLDPADRPAAAPQPSLLSAVAADTADAVLPPDPEWTSNVLAVIARIAGSIPITVAPHGLRTRQQQVGVSIGSVLTYLHDPVVAAAIRRCWSDSHILAVRHLPRRASQTWLAPDPDGIAPGVIARPGRGAAMGAHVISGRASTRTPGHLRIQTGQIVWQVCDREAWHLAATAWADAARYLGA